MLAEFLPPDEEHPQERRHIVSVFKLVQDLLEPSKVKGKSHFQLLMGKLPPDHKARWFAGAALNSAEQAMASVMSSTVVEKHIIPKLGDCCPLGFTTELMDDFIRELQFKDELAPKTVHDILVVLHGILKFTASKCKGVFPTVEINYPKIGKKEMRVLSREEQARFISYLQKDLDPCRFGILLALCTGIRIGELCALRWEYISTRDKAIKIVETLQRLRDTSASQNARTRIVIGPPKSDTSVRTIPMTEYAAGLCRHMKPQSSAAYVLTGTDAFMEPRVLQYRLEKYTQACGLEGVHFHTLRHTFATRAVEVGFEIKSLSEILGHASVTITLDRYVHSSLELKRDNITSSPWAEQKAMIRRTAFWNRVLRILSESS